MAWEEESNSKRMPDMRPQGFKYLEDDDVMPFGQYAKSSTKMKDVPASYLMFLWKDGCNNKSVKNYIARNWDRLNPK